MLTALDLIQWPAMIVTVLSARFVASQNKRQRGLGYWLFLMSNLLWIIWEWHDHVYALSVLTALLRKPKLSLMANWVADD